MKSNDTTDEKKHILGVELLKLKEMIALYDIDDYIITSFINLLNNYSESFQCLAKIESLAFDDAFVSEWELRYHNWIKWVTLRAYNRVIDLSVRREGETVAECKDEIASECKDEIAPENKIMEYSDEDYEQLLCYFNDRTTLSTIEEYEIQKSNEENDRIESSAMDNQKLNEIIRDALDSCGC